MKQIILSVFLVTFVFNLKAQKKPSAWYGLNASVVSGELIRYGGELNGGASYNRKVGYQLGVSFTKPLNKRFDFETGVEYSQSSFKISYIGNMGQRIQISEPAYVHLITVPLNLRINLGHRFYTSAGILIDQQFNTEKSSGIDKQSGLGVNLKIGRDFQITPKTAISIAPEFLLHALVPFSPEMYQQKLTKFGLRIGYKFGL